MLSRNLEGRVELFLVIIKGRRVREHQNSPETYHLMGKILLRQQGEQL